LVRHPNTGLRSIVNQPERKEIVNSGCSGNHDPSSEKGQNLNMTKEIVNSGCSGTHVPNSEKGQNLKMTRCTMTSGCSGICEPSHSNENKFETYTEQFKVEEVSMYGEANKHKAINLVIKTVINGADVDAIIDTAAQVTVLSYYFAKSLNPPLKTGNFVILKGAGKDSDISARYASSVTIKIGKTETKWRVIVANITDSVILGLDVLKHVKAVINLVDYEVAINGEIIPASIKDEKGGQIKVCRVELSRKVVVPPQTEVQLEAKLHGNCNGDVIVQPTTKLKGLLMPNILTSAKEQIPVILRNTTDKFITIKKQSQVGTATEIASIVDDQRETPTLNIRKIEGVVVSKTCEKELEESLPQHIQDLFVKSKKNLTWEQSQKLAELLLYFQDIFAKDELDIGHFTKIKHRIDTGHTTPVRERLRRAPIGFEKEEEVHLQDLLKKKIIQPSTSEWAAAPVLIRKKCGSLRYCIDYRKLNSLTKRDAFPLPRIESCLDTLKGTQFMSCLDMASRYYQT